MNSCTSTVCIPEKMVAGEISIALTKALLKLATKVSFRCPFPTIASSTTVYGALTPPVTAQMSIGSDRTPFAVTVKRRWFGPVLFGSSMESFTL